DLTGRAVRIDSAAAPARRLTLALRPEHAAAAGGLGAATAAHHAAASGRLEHSPAEHRVAEAELAVADRRARAAAAPVDVPDALSVDATAASPGPIGQELA